MDSTFTCPKCGAQNEHTRGYVDWCESCRWNAVPDGRVDVGRSLFDRIDADLAARKGARLPAAIPGRRGRTASLPGLMLSTAIVAASLASLFFGLYLALASWPNILLIIVGVILLLFGAVSLPVPPARPRGVLLDRERCGALFALVDELTAKGGFPNVGEIYLDERPRATVVEYGFGRRRALVLGWPLALALDGQELVAVLAREWAHLAERDPRRGFLFGIAANNLPRWHEFLHIPDLYRKEEGLWGMLAVPFFLVFRLLARGVSLVAYLLLRATRAESLRSRLRAEFRAAGLAGTDACLRVIDKPHLEAAFDVAVRRFSNSAGAEADFATVFREVLADFPDKERRRLALNEAGTAIGAAGDRSLAACRREAAQRSAAREPAVGLDASAKAAIDAELRFAEPVLAERIRERHAASNG